MTTEATGNDRVVWRVTGRDALTFLQGLVTNDVLPLAKGPGIVWAALLTPQGKYLADFFVVALPGGEAGSYMIDIDAVLAPATLQRLSMYRLRADVAITAAPLFVHRGDGTLPEDALPDPRHATMGWRAWRDHPEIAAAPIDWDARRVAALVPQTGVELIPNETFILEAGFEALHGVDFRKGCYVGQEVTARMKHKTDLRKGLARVRIEGQAPVGTEILAGDKSVGTLFTQARGQAIAHLRHDRAEGVMRAGDATVTLIAG